MTAVGAPVCDVCGGAITADQRWVFHQRLRAAVHVGCPLTNVRGEDISQHTLMWHWPEGGHQ